MARDPKPALFALAARGMIRLRELEGDRLKVARPEGHPNRAVVIIDRYGAWTDQTIASRKGDGLFQLGRYLDIPFDEIANAY
jgi:hypothetical protein